MKKGRDIAISTLPLYCHFTTAKIPNRDFALNRPSTPYRWNMIMEFLYSLFGSNPGQTERQDTLAPVVTAKASRSEKYESDIRAITDKYGELTPGLCIETTLQDLLTIVPRHRPRIDAYNGLVTELRAKHGVILSILSRKTKKTK